MLEFCDQALLYAAGLEFEVVRADRMRYDAILRNIELIGEASTRLTPEVRALAPQIPWREIVGTRNRVAHGYLGINPGTVRDLLTHELPALRVQLLELLSRMPLPPAPTR